MNKTELKEKLDQIREKLKDFNLFIHLFSKDEGKKILTELNQLMSQISLLLNFQDLKEICHPVNKAISKKLLFGGECGDLVLVRPCKEEYKKKTFLGFLIGEVALSSSLSIKDNKIQCNFAHYNPAILVPELKEIIYGCNSWWTKIESVDDFKKITNKDIDSTWYVKLWKEMSKNNNENRRN